MSHSVTYILHSLALLEAEIPLALGIPRYNISSGQILTLDSTVSIKQLIIFSRMKAF